MNWTPWLGVSQPHLGGPIAAYEGGLVVHGKGIWHPSPIPRMRDSSRQLDAMGKERAIHSIHERVDPIDAFAPDNSGVLFEDARLFVRVKDPEVIRVEWRVEWRVDGHPVRSGEGILDLSDLGLTFGFHLVEGVARDEVLDHAFSDNASPHPLEQVCRNLDGLTQTIAWTVFAH